MSISFDVKEILICLKNTYSSPDKKVREESEKKLASLKNQNIVEFTSQLITLLKTDSPEIDKNIKLSIILLIKRSLREKIENEEINKIQNEQLIQQLIIILVYPSLSKKEIENLSEVLKLSTFISIKEEHISNIPLISATLLVLKFDTFNSFKEEQ